MKLVRKIAPLILLAVASFYFLFQISCNTENKNPSNGNDTTQRKTAVTPPDFDADSTYAWIKKQVDFSPRIPGTAAQKKCAEWLQKKLESFPNSNVTVQKGDVTIYDGRTLPCYNIIAKFNVQASTRILLFTHWDTRPWSDQDEKEKKKQFDGADDGGSGTAVLLQIAKLLGEKSCNVGVDILLEDVEDYGAPYFEPAKGNDDKWYCLGTQDWIKKAKAENYHAYYGILLDMVGSRGAKFYMDPSAPDVSKKIFDAAQQLGFGNYFQMQLAPGGIVDDNSFVNAQMQIPSADIIALDLTNKTTFAKHWHTQQDNMNIIDKQTLKAVGQTLLQVIYNE